MKRKFSDSYISYRIECKRQHIFEDGFMNYIYLTSLENATIVKLVTQLLQNGEFADILEANMFDRSLRSLCPQLVNEMLLENISQLHLPNPMKQKLSKITKTIASLAVEWVHGRKERFFYDFLNKRPIFRYRIQHIDSMSWTTAGTIDEAKELDFLLGSDRYGNIIIHAYRMACYYCAEDHIVKLWGRMSAPTKKRFISGKLPYNTYGEHFTAYWSYLLTGKLRTLMSVIKPKDRVYLYRDSYSINANMVTLCIAEGVMPSLKYFFSKLTGEEVCRNIKRWTEQSLFHRHAYKKHCNYQEHNNHTDVICFLLSQLIDKEQQRYIFKENASVILRSLFYNWPWQRFFMPTLDCMWDFLRPKTYAKLFGVVVEQMQYGSNVEVFKELWEGTPPSFQKNIFEYLPGHSQVSAWIVVGLTLAEDLETLFSFMTGTKFHEKRRMVNAAVNSSGLRLVVEQNKLNIFDQVLAKTLDGNVNMINEVKGHSRSFSTYFFYEYFGKTYDYDVVEELVEWSFNSDKKRVQHFKNELDKTSVAKNLIRVEECAALNNYLNWCFSGNEKAIGDFKQELLLEIGRIVVKTSPYCNQFSMYISVLERFVCTCFNTDEEIEKAKKFILRTDKILNLLFQEIKSRSRIEFTERMLFWSLDTEEEVVQFKEKLILGRKGKHLLEILDRTWLLLKQNCNALKTLAVWLYPIKPRVVSKLQEIMDRTDHPSHGVERKRKSVFRSLISFAAELDGASSVCSTCGSDNGDEHVRNNESILNM